MEKEMEKEKTNLKILFKSLRKYNLSKEKFNIYKIDDLIFNRNKRFVSIFKDYLFINDDTEFLFLFYLLLLLFLFHFDENCK